MGSGVDGYLWGLSCRKFPPRPHSSGAFSRDEPSRERKAHHPKLAYVEIWLAWLVYGRYEFIINFTSGLGERGGLLRFIGTDSVFYIAQYLSTPLEG